MRTLNAFLAPGIGLLSAAMFAAPVLASDSKGNFALHGVGAQSCQLMLQELQPAAPVALSAVPLAPSASASSAASPSASPAVAISATTAASPKGAPAGPVAPSASSAAAAQPGPASSALGMRPILTSWIMGYLTASDRMVKDTFDGTPVMAPEALTTMVIGVCRRYPNARVESVASNVLSQLAPARVLHESPVVEARSGDRMVMIRKATLIAVQNTLVKSKLLKEPADGTFGSSTAAALETFQKSQNLPVTGLPDASTVVRLLIEMPTKVAAK